MAFIYIGSSFLMILLTVKSDNCTIRDHCLNGIEIFNSNIISQRNCFCDEICSIYGDCCEDLKATFYGNNKIKELEIDHECVDYNYPIRRKQRRFYEMTMHPVWMITGCQKKYYGTKLDKQCQSYKKDHFNEQPDAYIPWTSNRTNLTYRNIYCALCNNQNNFLQSWIYKPECDSSLTFPTIINNITEIYQFLNCNNHYLTYPSVFIRFCKKIILNQSCSDIRCQSINAYRYISYKYGPSAIVQKIFRNKYCLQCYDKNISLSESCFDQINLQLNRSSGEQITGTQLLQLSILFNPEILKIRLTDTSNKTVKSNTNQYFINYPCNPNLYQLYDLVLKECISISSNNDRQLLKAIKCLQPVRIHKRYLKELNNGSMTIKSYSIILNSNDFIYQSDGNEIIFCGEEYPQILYFYNNIIRSIVSYICTIVSLSCLLLFMVCYCTIPVLHNLPGQ
ncbi:unnamed protein product [Didymodactylos carnosus]|uniref:SMB domain-containing protein n=1 Tax=Didymodactylos carnosus TaxID=1234261 RepID=A0A814Y6I3_9BILA|nr:unnamed protein product [Didymodactylos carnosus]CAF1300692.1 unnamed protein product [Didymodactylos carnosus]CAF3988491.1 unnamed protein product [Didymodactylos carnosus]CAF4106840.1 unnamed protein product [Didymodactylos carnosus]